jgi:hypothetical protein
MQILYPNVMPSTAHSAELLQAYLKYIHIVQLSVDGRSLDRKCACGMLSSME